MPSSILNSDDGVISGTSGLKSSGGDDGVLVFQSKGTETARINTDSQIVAAAGTASLPALTTTGDVNTGIFFPAADTIAFAEGGAEAMRIDSSGNVGIGATSPDLFSFGSTYKILTLQNTATDANAFQFLVANGTGESGIQFTNQTYRRTSIGSDNASNLTFATNGTNSSATGLTERMRITSGGYFKATSTGSYSDPARAIHEFRTAAADDWILRLSSTNASPYGLNIQFTGGSPNNTSNDFIGCSDSTTTRFQVRSNGGIGNYSANNVNLSDRREKTNFAPAKNYLETICAIPVQTFNYIDQNQEDDPGLTLGVVAQDVQEVAPELVMESNWAGKDEEPKMRLSIYQTDFQYALMKCIQELKAELDEAKARIAALEAVPGNE
jgi:trimeric autotransporter adhesin